MLGRSATGKKIITTFQSHTKIRMKFSLFFSYSLNISAGSPDIQGKDMPSEYSLAK